jgi:HEAT repeat protein
MQTISTPTTPSKWAQLVAQMPRPDKGDKTLKNVAEGQVEKLVAELAAGGREAVVALVDMLAEPAEGPSDSPVRHALHALVMHAGGLGDERRRAVAAALASTLNDRERSAGVRKFVVRQLELCGGPEVTPALGRFLRDDELSNDAAMALLAIRTGAAEQFRAALADLVGPQRVAAIVALGTLRDAQSVDALRGAARRDPDPVARLEAAWALANLGDAASADAILAVAEDANGFDRDRASSACLLLAENMLAAGRRDQAVAIYRRLLDTRKEPVDAHVRAAAERGVARATKTQGRE